MRTRKFEIRRRLGGTFSESEPHVRGRGDRVVSVVELNPNTARRPTRKATSLPSGPLKVRGNLVSWAGFAAKNFRWVLFCFFLATAVVLGVLAHSMTSEIPTPLANQGQFLIYFHPFPDFLGIYPHLPSCCWDQVVYVGGLWVSPLSLWCVIFAMCTRLTARQMLGISALTFELDVGFWILVVQRNQALSSTSPLALLYDLLFQTPTAFIGSRELVFLALLVFMAACSYLVFNRIQRVVQTVTAALITLPATVWVWDRHDWTVHFTTPIVATLMPWFTNEVLFYACLLVFAVATLLDVLKPRYLGRGASGRRFNERDGT